MKKYGVEHFNMRIIEECDYDVIEERERYWIETLNTIEPNGYNILCGGKHLYEKDNPFYGKHHSDDTKRIISEKNTGRVASDEERKMRSIINSGKRNPFYGRKHSKETIAIIQQKNKENGCYKKASERMKNNNPCKPEIAYKPVVMKNKNGRIVNIFESLTSAGRYIKSIGLSKAIKPENQIGAVCNGKQKSAYGYLWEFLKLKIRTYKEGKYLTINKCNLE